MALSQAAITGNHVTSEPWAYCCKFRKKGGGVGGGGEGSEDGKSVVCCERLCTFIAAEWMELSDAREGHRRKHTC